MLEDKQAQQLYRTAALHELWARTHLSDKSQNSVSLHETERVVFACRLPVEQRRSILGHHGGALLLPRGEHMCLVEDSTMRGSVIGCILILALAILVTPLAAEAQRPTHVHRIGYLGVTTTQEQKAFLETFLEGMRALGYVEGQNLILEYRAAEGHYERLRLCFPQASRSRKLRRDSCCHSLNGYRCHPRDDLWLSQ